MSCPRTIASIGIGVMGYPMVTNLREKIGPNATLLICDIAQDTIERFQKESIGKGPVKVVKNGSAAAQVADIVITILPDDAAVESVYLNPESGILSGIPLRNFDTTNNPIIIECGTVESSSIDRVAKSTQDLNTELSHGRSVQFVDAPVSGGPMGAQERTRTFMVGSHESIFEPVRDVLKYMGNPEGVFHCGEVGAGTAFKVINNYLSAITSLAASEALNIGDKMGLGFRIELCTKVLQMGSDLGKMVGARIILDRPTLDAFHEASEDPRYKGKDARVVYKWLNEQN